MQDGMVWNCNRPAALGGPCPEGPSAQGVCGHALPRCTPRPTLRTQRGMLVATLTLAAVGGLLVLLSSASRNALLAPGDLTEHHAQLLSLQGERRCQACHEAGEQEPLTWVRSLWQSHDPSIPNQTSRCLVCHGSRMDPTLALYAHTLAPDHLRSMTDVISSRLGREPLRRAALPDPSRNIACAACHREHHGRKHDLKALSNSHCQTCHQSQFHSFADGHPDFGDWPYDRSRSMVFDHASHASKHFAVAEREFRCLNCHQSESDKDVTRITSYAMCAHCHEERIRQSSSSGIVILSLPMIDTVALSDAGFDVGEWPPSATGDFDGRLDPTLAAILSLDPDANLAISHLGDEFDFYDVDLEDRQQMADVATLIWGVKRAIHRLAVAGPDAVTRLLIANVRAPSHVTPLAESTTATWNEVADVWFPNLNVELASRDAREKGEDTREPESKITNPDMSRRSTNDGSASRGQWWVDHDLMQVRYAPSGHADNVLGGWFEILAARARQSQSALPEPWFKPTGVGLCASCHRPTEPTSSQSDFFTSRRHGSPNRFTRFSHGPHLLIPHLADCRACHPVVAEAAVSPVTDIGNAHHTADFMPMSRSNCAACHTSNGAGDQCTKCHRYHAPM